MSWHSSSITNILGVAQKSLFLTPAKQRTYSCCRHIIIIQYRMTAYILAKRVVSTIARPTPPHRYEFLSLRSGSRCLRIRHNCMIFVVTMVAINYAVLRPQSRPLSWTMLRTRSAHYASVHISHYADEEIQVRRLQWPGCRPYVGFPCFHVFRQLRWKFRSHKLKRINSLLLCFAVTSAARTAHRTNRLHPARSRVSLVIRSMFSDIHFVM